MQISRDARLLRTVRAQLEQNNPMTNLTARKKQNAKENPGLAPDLHVGSAHLACFDMCVATCT